MLFRCSQRRALTEIGQPHYRASSLFFNSSCFTKPRTYKVSQLVCTKQLWNPHTNNEQVLLALSCFALFHWLIHSKYHRGKYIYQINFTILFTTKFHLSVKTESFLPPLFLRSVLIGFLISDYRSFVSVVWVHQNTVLNINARTSSIIFFIV
jgi:hypothetical protein